MDQIKVTSGFDLEVAIGGGYLTNLLLLASDVGILPLETTFGTNPVTVRVMQPPGVDRTYRCWPRRFRPKSPTAAMPLR